MKFSDRNTRSRGSRCTLSRATKERVMHVQDGELPDPPLRTSRVRRGFTLVSMVVAMVLMGVGVGALAHSSAETLKSQNIAQNKTNAIAIARAYVEKLRTRDPWALENEAGVKVDADGTVSNSGRFSRSLAMVVERQNLLRLTVTVKFPRMVEPVVLTTFLYRGNPLAAMGG